MKAFLQQIISGISRHKLLIILALGVFVTDQVTKHWAANLSGFALGAYPPIGGIEIIPGFFSLVYATNEGAAWGLFAEHGEFLVLTAVLVLGAIIVFRRYLELDKLIPQIGFGVLIGGILGNLVDRAMHGHVIDFIDVHLGFYRWPTFNVADMGIVIGVILYVAYGLVADRRERRERLAQQE